MSQERTKSVALAAAAAGGVLSLGLLLFAARHGTPPIVLILMAGWVVSPFLLLAVANAMSTRWPPTARAALYRVTVGIAAASVAIYALDTVKHLGGKPAAIFVMIPPLSWLVALLFVGPAALRARSQRA